MSNTLLPCPFCGDESIDATDFGASTWFVQCDDCGATFPHFDTETEAIAAWNRRAKRTGRWIAEQKDTEYCEFRCSACDHSVGQTDQFNETEVTQFSEWYSYCPNCGARMDGERRNDDA